LKVVDFIGAGLISCKYYNSETI